MFMLTLVDQEFAALETDASTNLHDFLQVLNKEDGACQFDMTKISRRIDIGKSICGTDSTGLQDAHARIKESTNDGFIVYIGISRGHLDNGIFLISSGDKILNWIPMIFAGALYSFVLDLCVDDDIVL